MLDGKPIQGNGVELTGNDPANPVAVVVQAEAAVGVAPSVYTKDSDLTTESPPAKKYWVLSLLSVIGMALIADGSFKAFVACPITITAQPGVGLQSGRTSVDQGCSPGSTSCQEVQLQVPGDPPQTVSAPTCAMALNGFQFSTAQQQYSACTAVPGCEYYYKSRTPSTTQPTGLGCTITERDASSAPGALACGCGLDAQLQLNAKLTIDLDVKLGQAEICMGCRCTEAEDPSVNGISSSCAATGGGCLDESSLQSGEGSSGGGLSSFNVDFGKLAGGNLCYGVNDLFSGGQKPPSWVEPVVKLSVVLPAIILALLLVYYVYLSFKKTTVAEASSSGKCCGAMVYNCTFAIAVILAGLIGAVFVFALPKIYNDQLSSSTGGGSHFLAPTATPVGTFSITLPTCEAGAGAKAELAGGIIALVAWLLSCKCSGCCRF